MAPTAMDVPAGSAVARVHDPSDEPRPPGFLPERLPAQVLAGAWTDLDVLAHAAAVARAPEEARKLVERSGRAGELAVLRQRVNRLSPPRARAAAMRVAVIAAACGWSDLDPLAPESRRVARQDFLGLWASLAHRGDHERFVALPTLALLNWAPRHKSQRTRTTDQLARCEVLVPIVRWSPAGQPLSRIDRFMLAAVRLEAQGIWLLRIAESLAGRGPGDETVAMALCRFTRIQHVLRGQLRTETVKLAMAPTTAQQRGVLRSLAERGALEPPILLAADTVLGIGGRQGGTSRQQLRRHLPAEHRCRLSALDRDCAPLRTLAHRSGPDADAYREAQESLIVLRRTYTELVHTAMAPG
ncbi:hypothetical protein CP970_38610 [Streptomyces kanamyceticus]|uniref:Uncharacterized protein n=2 Tax=Streptomyces kanamyceticus TaxID=1967 RepID=A0A5J6GJK2_STRKN|nr:hypothetical protein [Streptomyces kanamyceticus]QEU96060.1 hypothetical protein CP970_38610 [Streptomyces kanamyceticus]